MGYPPLDLMVTAYSTVRAPSQGWAIVRELPLHIPNTQNNWELRYLLVEKIHKEW